MQIYLILIPSHEAEEPVTRAFLHRATWISELRRRFGEDDNHPSTLSEEELFTYMQTQTDDSAIECTLIGPDVDPNPGYQRVVVIDNNDGEFKVYSNPSCLPPLKETDDIYHIPIDKWDVDHPRY